MSEEAIFIIVLGILCVITSFFAGYYFCETRRLMMEHLIEDNEDEEK